jgi:hypothetical protein
MSHCVRVLLLQGVLQAGRTRRRVRREAVWYLPRDRSGATARLTGDRDAVGDAAGQRLVGGVSGSREGSFWKKRGLPDHGPFVPSALSAP